MWRRQGGLPVGPAFILSLLVHAVIAWLLLVPEAPSEPLGGAPGVSVLFELPGPGGGGGSAGDPAAEPDAVPGENAAATSGDASEPATDAPSSSSAETPTEPEPAAAAIAETEPVEAAAAPPPEPEPVAAALPVESLPEPTPEPAVESIPEPARPEPTPVAMTPPATEPPPEEASRTPEPKTMAAAPRLKPRPPEPARDEPQAAQETTASPAPLEALADPGKLADVSATQQTDVSGAPGAQLASLRGLPRAAVGAGPGDAGGAIPRPGGGDGGVQDDFLARLQVWLERHKRYPRRARLRNEEGVVLVRFLLGGDGTVSGIELAHSSGHALLDEEATALLARAQPLPRGRLTGVDGPLRLEVPIRFALH